MEMEVVFDLTTLVIWCCPDDWKPTDRTWIMMVRIWLGLFIDAALVLVLLEVSSVMFYLPIYRTVILAVIILAEVIFLLNLFCGDYDDLHHISRKEIMVCVFKAFSTINPLIIIAVFFPYPKDEICVPCLVLLIDFLMNAIELMIALDRRCCKTNKKKHHIPHMYI